MLTNNSSLDALTAFAIVFALGVLSTVALSAYTGKVKRDARNEVS